MANRTQAKNSLTPQGGHENFSRNIEIIKLALQALATAGIIFAAISVWIAYRAFHAQDEWNRRQTTVAFEAYKAQHEWNRREYTAELLRNYDRDARQYSDELNKAFRNLIHADKGYILSKEEAEKIYKTQDKKRTNIVAYLNYMEYVCIAYEADVVNREIIYKAFSGVFTRRYLLLKAFIDYAQDQQEQQRGNKFSWQPIVRVVGEWHSRDTPPIEDRGKTGDAKNPITTPSN